MDTNQPVEPIVPVTPVVPVEQTEEQLPDFKKIRETIRPKHNCRKCHGTGRLGFIDGDMNNVLPCSCVIRAYQKARATDKAAVAVAAAEAEAARAATGVTDVKPEVQPTEDTNDIPSGT